MSNESAESNICASDSRIHDTQMSSGDKSAAQLLLKIHTHVMDARQYWSLRRQEWEKTVASNYFCKITHCWRDSRKRCWLADGIFGRITFWTHRKILWRQITFAKSHIAEWRWSDRTPDLSRHSIALALTVVIALSSYHSTNINWNHPAKSRSRQIMKMSTFTLSDITSPFGKEGTHDSVWPIYEEWYQDGGQDFFF